MLDFVLWTIVLVAVGAAIAGSVHLAESSWNAGVLTPLRNRVICAGVCAVLLIILALAYQARTIAKPDAILVEHLAGSPNGALAKAMTYVTLIGDSIPSLLIATVLAVVIQRQGKHRYLALLLPVVVLAELYVQLGMGKVFDDYTIAMLKPDVPIGGTGFIPSGSVARLLSVFLIAAWLWSSHDARGARMLATIGGLLTAVQIVSRLVLGRHLLADIAGGVLLGLVLALVATVLVPRAHATVDTRAAEQARHLTAGVHSDDRTGSRPVLASRIRLRRSTRG